MKSFLLFLLLYYSSLAKDENYCRKYSGCRMELLSRKFSCLEEPRKAVEQTCRLKEDLRLVWKASLAREKFTTSCLLREAGPSPHSSCFEFPQIDTNSLEKCGLSLRLLEEKCDVLKHCCESAEKCLTAVPAEKASKALKQRIKLVAEKADFCNKRMFTAIQNLTSEDVELARILIKRTTRIRELLFSLFDPPIAVPSARVPAAPLFKTEKVIKSQRRAAEAAVFTIDSDTKTYRRSPPRFVRIQTADFETTENNSKSKAFYPPFFRSSSPLHKRKAKTLFIHLLNAKRRGTMRPWREARTRSIAIPRRLNTSRRIVSSYNIPISRTTKEDYWKGRIEAVRRRKLQTRRRIIETTLKPLFLGMRFVDKNTDKKEEKVPWAVKQKEEYNKGKSSSEEDFDEEFERKANSLVSFGPNALPLPGSGKYSSSFKAEEERPHRSTKVDNPFEDIVVKKELNTADVMDIGTVTPFLRPRPRVDPLHFGHGLTTLSPIPLSTSSLWDPLLSLFSTPAPFNFRPAYPVRIWPFKKVLRGVRINNGEAIADKLREQKLAQSIKVSGDTPTDPGSLGSQLDPGIMDVTVTDAGSSLDSEQRSHCIRYQTCLAVLGQTEGQCELKSRSKRAKQSLCIGLDEKLQISELVKAVEHGYRKCVLADEEGHNVEEPECSTLPTLPAGFYLYKTCNKKLGELRRHCQLASRCCSTTTICQMRTVSSSIFSDLKTTQKKRKPMKYRCQQKRNQLFSRTAISIVEGDARMEGV